MRPPCRDCQERCVGCHDSCSRYAEYRAERDRLLEEKRLRVDVREARRAAFEKCERPWLMKRKRSGR